MSAKMAPAEQAAPGLKVRPNWRSFGLRAFVSIAILAPFAYFFHPSELVAAMKKTGFVLWASTVGSAVFFHIILAAKWRLLLKAAGNGVGRMDSLRAHGAGLFANICLPSLIGGDVVRTGMVTRDTKHLPSALTGVVADRLTDVASLLVLAGAGMLLLPTVANRTEVSALVIVAFLMAGGMLAGVITIRRIDTGKLPARIAHTIDGLKLALDTMFQRKTDAMVALAVTIFIQALFIFQNVLIANAVGIHVPVAVWLIAFPLAKLIAFLPLSLGGLGVREGVVAAVLLPFAVPTTLAVAQSLVWQTVTFSTGLVGGAGALWIGYQRSRAKKA